MDIGVIGGGSIGLLTSYYLKKQGHTVTLYVRREAQKQALLEKGLSIQPMEDKVFLKVQSFNCLEEHDLLFVCTKQQAIPSLLEYVAKRNNSPVLFVQNGMGHVPFIKQLSNPVVIGVMEHGALREGDANVRHTGRGQLRIAGITLENEDLQFIGDQLSSQVFPVHIEQNWYNMLARKLVINAVINPITALFEIKNGGILTNPYVERISERLCEETCTILELSFEEQMKRVRQIATSTKENTSSMLKDIQTKRETEVEAILGFLLRESSCEPPYIKHMYESIKALEYEFKKEGEI